MKHLSSLFIILCILFTSCNKTEYKRIENIQNNNTTRLHVGVLPTIDCLPLLYAEKCGIFDKLNANIDFHYFLSHMDCDTAFMNLKVDIAHTDLFRCAFLYHRGVDIKAVLQTNGYHKLITSNRDNVKDIKDLRENMVAISRHSVVDFLLDTIVGKIKVDPLSVYHPQINDILLRYDMLNNGTINTAILPDILAEQSINKGAKELFDSRCLNSNFMCFATTQQVLKDSLKLDEIYKLKEAYNIAVEHLNKGINRDSLTKIVDVFRLQISSIDSMKSPQFYPLQPIDEDNIAIVETFLNKRHLSKRINYKKIIHNDIALK